MTERPGSSTREDGTVSWGDLIEEAESRLRRAGLDAPAIDARRIVEEVSGFDGARLTVERSSLVTQRAMARYDDLVARRAQGEPLQYVLGHWAFRSLDLMVDRRVLIPRPETEEVVGIALSEIDRMGGAERPTVVVDLGTGSGAMALSIAVEHVRTTVWATDVSGDAIDVARANLAGIGRAGARVRIGQGEWFDALPGELRGHVDVIVSNPPYVTDSADLPHEVRGWEPAAALFAGEDGLTHIRRIVSGAPEWLSGDGRLVCELSPEQGESVAELAGERFAEVELAADLTGRTRALVARHPLR